jgi:hypothetical protein
MSQARRSVSEGDDRIAHRDGVLARWDGIAGMRETVKIKDTKDGCGGDGGNMSGVCSVSYLFLLLLWDFCILFDIFTSNQFLLYSFFSTHWRQVLVSACAGSPSFSTFNLYNYNYLQRFHYDCYSFISLVSQRHHVPQERILNLCTARRHRRYRP